MYSLEDLQLGAKGDIKKLSQGRRFELTLGGQGDSHFSYRAVLLDAREDSGPFIYNCGVFIVPKVCPLYFFLIFIFLFVYSWYISSTKHFNCYSNQNTFEFLTANDPETTTILV